MDVLSISVPLLLYGLAYGIAGLGCAIAFFRARTVEDPGTRRGLEGLFVGSGGWAFSHLGFLLAPTQQTAYAMYLVSLIIGLTTVGAWLYFCSAYTGRSFHRDRTYRRLAVAVYLIIVGFKLTNPIHNLYFTVEFVTTPFAHLAIRNGIIHWVVTGLSYSLASIGFFMLFEMFLEADYNTRPLGAVVVATGLPIVFDIAGFLTPWLIDINYEPLGVAVFAIGSLYVFKDRFLAVQLTDSVEGALVYLDSDDRIREFNGRARELFPALAGSQGQPLADVLPAVTDRLDAEDSILERDRSGQTKYYLVSDSRFTLGQTDIGQLVMFNDVTETERQRRELRRHNEQLEDFAAAIRHELLNTLQVVDGWVMTAGEALDSGDVERANTALRTATDMTDRMTEIVDDLAELARYGRTADQFEPVAFADVVHGAFDAAGTDDLSLSVPNDGTVEANRPRLDDLCRNAFQFATHNDATTVTVTLREDGFTITDDGEPVGTLDSEAFFEYGEAVPNSAAGMALPNLRMLARTQGWNAEIDDTYDEGIRIVVSGVRVQEIEE